MVGQEITGVPLPFPSGGGPKQRSQSQSCTVNAVMGRKGHSIFLSTHQLNTLSFFCCVLSLSLSLLVPLSTSSTFILVDNASLEIQTPWPTHQPSLQHRTISHPIGAGTIAEEEAEEQTELRAKVRMANSHKAAIEMLAEAEVVEDAPTEEGQEGHTNPTMRKTNPPPNNRSKQRERPSP